MYCGLFFFCMWSLFCFSTTLYKSNYSFGKTRLSSFWVLIFRVSVSLVFSFSVICFEFNVISKVLSGSIISHVLFDFVLTSYNLLKHKNFIIKNMLPLRFWVCKGKYPLHKKWSFPLRISSVNVTKSTISCGFGHIYWSNHHGAEILVIWLVEWSAIKSLILYFTREKQTLTSREISMLTLLC